jgi:hypothetical protein
MADPEETRQEDMGSKDTSQGPESQCLNPLDPTTQDAMEHGAKQRSPLVTDPEYPGREVIIEIARKLLDSFEQK